MSDVAENAGGADENQSESASIASGILLGFCIVMPLFGAGMALFPGTVSNLLVFSVFLCALALMVLGPVLIIFLGARLWQRRRLNFNRRFVKNASLICGSLFLTLFSSLSVFPIKCGMLFYRSKLENLLEEVQAARPTVDFHYQNHARLTINRRIGPFYVDEAGFDRRGGLFFRFDTGFDMVDEMSYGFAFNPNKEGSPFGAAGYDLTHLTSDWYYFSVSDDHY